LTAWTPILSPGTETSALAWESIHAIAQAVIAKDYDISEQEKRRERSYEPALLYGYMALALDDIEWANRATESLNLAIEQAAHQAGYVGLYGGLTGLGWTVEHLSRLFQRIAEEADPPQSDNASEEDLNADIDAMIMRHLPRMTPSSPYDLISGLVGLGTYFFERLPRETAAPGIRAVFDQLESLAQQTEAGMTWFSGPELLPEWQRELCPNGYYNLGVAHGIPGIIHFLNEVSATQIVEPDRSCKLRDGAVQWLIAQARPPGSASRFSSWVVPGEQPTDSRMAWCYGDLGILSVLLQVARRADRTDWRQFSNELLDHCLAWPLDNAGIGDAPLCHGAVGVAHIFNRIYQETGDRRCLDASLLWFDRTLAMRHPGTGVGGYSSLTRPDPLEPVVWEASAAFLDGSIGVALALLSALTPVESAWDRMLLLSGRH
jgi:hypothetical protein